MTRFFFLIRNKVYSVAFVVRPSSILDLKCTFSFSSELTKLAENNSTIDISS